MPAVLLLWLQNLTDFLIIPSWKKSTTEVDTFVSSTLSAPDRALAPIRESIANTLVSKD